MNVITMVLHISTPIHGALETRTRSLLEGSETSFKPVFVMMTRYDE